MTTLHVAMRDRLLTVRGGAGGGWRADRSLGDHAPECVAVHPDAPERVLCGTYDAGLRRSTDGGETWARVGARKTEADAAERRSASPRSRIREDAVMSVAVDPNDPDVAWAGTEPSAVYRSTDGGATWEEREGLTDLPSEPEWSFPPRPHTHHVRWLEVDPGDPDHLYVGVEAGALAQTRDAGESWEDRVSSARLDNHSLDTHPDVPERAWSAAGDGYAESRDRGETWTHPQEGLEHRYCWSVAVDAADPDTVLLSAARGAGEAHGHGGAENAESYLYRKRGDEAWERLDDRGLPTGEGVLRAVIERGAAGGEFYAANNRGLFATADAGDSWERLDVDWSAFETQAARGLAVVP